MKPRPMMRELVEVLEPLGYNTRRHKHCVPDPDRPDYLKHDPEGYQKLLEEERQKRRQRMTEIMRMRGIDYGYSAEAIEKEVQAWYDKKSRKFELPSPKEFIHDMADKAAQKTKA